MSTETLNRPETHTFTDAEIQAMFENEPPCQYIRRTGFPNGRVTFRCENAATWGATCRKCGKFAFLCDYHYQWLISPVKGTSIRCEVCGATASHFADLYMMAHKV